MTHFAPLDDGFEELSATPRRLRRTHQLMIGAIVALLVVGGGAWWLVHRTSTDKITFAGVPISDPGGVLDTASARFDSYTHANDGRVSTDARCWFERAAATTDVQRTVLCGPVQFYDGTPSKPYLGIPLYPVGSDRPVHLELGLFPTVPGTVAAPAAMTLVRPGDTTAPLATAGIATPVPPPAARGVLVATDAVHPAALTRAPPFSLIGADFCTIRLQSYGPVAHFGSGPSERSAPTGQQLLAFRLTFGGGENGFALLTEVHLGVSLGTGAVRPLHLSDDMRAGGQMFVVAVARGEPVSLDLTENRITQRLSLRTGRPASGNITILRNGGSDGAYTASGIATASVTDRGRRSTATLYLTVLGARTGFFIPGTGQHPRSTNDMFLSLDVVYYLARIPATSYQQLALSARSVTVTPLGGRPVQGRELPGGSGHVVFEVPAAMADATINIAGSESNRAFSMTITTPLHLRLRLNRLP